MGLSVIASLVIRNALTREGLRRILSDSGFEIAQSTAEVEDLAIEPHVDNHIIVVDYSWIHNDLSHEIDAIIARFPKSKLVVIKEKFDLDLMARAFSAGAHGYILQDVPYESFVAMMQLVSMGEKVAPSKLIDTLQDLYAAGTQVERVNGVAHFDLNERERDILDRLVMGRPNKLIARELGISEASVKVAVKAIFRKLSVKNRTQAAIMARESGLISSGLMSSVDKIAMMASMLFAASRFAFENLPTIV